MAKYNGNRALGILAENWDSGDSWGSTLDALGACCDLLTILDSKLRVPADAGYVPAGLPDADELREAASADNGGDLNWSLTGLAQGYWNIGMVDEWEPFSLDDVEQAAIILTRWANVLKSAGEDY